MPDQQSADNRLLISRDTAEMAVCAALRLFIGRGRRYSVKQVSNATGVKDRAIECAMATTDNADHRALNMGALLSIAGFLGSDFTNEWLSLAGQGAFDLPEEEPSPGDLAADAIDDAAAIARAARHGEFTASDRKILSVVGAHMMHEGAELVAMQAHHRSGASAAGVRAA